MTASDTYLFIGAVVLLVCVNFAVALITDEFGSSTTTYLTDDIQDSLEEEAEGIGALSTGWSVFYAIIGIFAWNIDINVWMNLLLWIPRLVGYITFARMIRGVG